MERFDLYNRNRERTGKTLERGEKVPEDFRRLVVHVCVFGTDGRMLVQRRIATKKGWPGMWDVSMGGSAQAGETSLDATVRELSEELGLRPAPSAFMPCVTIFADDVIDDYYTVTMDVKPDSLVLQPEEVWEVKQATADEIKGMIRAGVFIPYHEGLIDLLFYMGKNGSARTERDKSKVSESSAY